MQSTSSRLAAISLSPSGIFQLGLGARDRSPGSDGGGKVDVGTAKAVSGDEVVVKDREEGRDGRDGTGEQEDEDNDVEDDQDEQDSSPETSPVGSSSSHPIPAPSSTSPQPAPLPAGVLPRPSLDTSEHVRLISNDGIIVQPAPESPPPSYEFATLSYNMVSQLRLEREREEAELSDGPASGEETPPTSTVIRQPASPPSLPASTSAHPTPADAGPSHPPPPPPTRPSAYSSTSMLELLPPSDSESDDDLPNPRSSSPTPAIQPPLQSRHHRRPSSPASIRSLIQIMDHTGELSREDDADEVHLPPGLREGFARDVAISRWRIVGGSKWNDGTAHGEAMKVKLGAYVVFDCEITTRIGPVIVLRRRYTDFLNLRDQLRRAFPRLRQTIPQLPPKKVMSKFEPSYLDRRKVRLQYWLKTVMLHPVLGTSSQVKEWVLQA